MTKNSDANDVSRRTVLKRGAIVSGGVLVGGSAMTGTAAASPRTNFAYVSNDVEVGDVVTLESRGGRPNLNCNDAGANIRTTEWTVSFDDGSGNDTWYFIPNGYSGGEEVEVTGEAISCADSTLADKEVEVTLQ